MAFQRPFLISLKRGDSSQRWGFGIKGGREYGETIKIQSVCEDSLAEKCGLHEGDEVIQVGRVNVQDLTLDQAHQVLARCGNKIEMFVIREDLLSPRKGKEPPVVKAVVHNPYNSPLSLYSAQNVAETLAQQTEVLTEGCLSGEDEEGPENLSFQQKSAVFQLLEEQAKQDVTGSSKSNYQNPPPVRKPKSAPPPPPPKPKPPSNEPLYNGFGSHQQEYQDYQRSTDHVERHTTHKVLNLQQYREEQPTQYQQTQVYKTTSYQTSPGYQSPGNQQSVTFQNQQAPQSPTSNYQQSYQQLNQSNYQQSYQSQQHPGHQSPGTTGRQQQHPGYQSPTTAPSYQQLNQCNYQQNRGNVYHQGQESHQQVNYQHQQSVHQQPQQQTQQVNYQQTHQSSQQQKSKQKVKFAPDPPPRGTPSSRQGDEGRMAAVYKQQYEQHLQKQFEKQQALANSYEDDDMKPRAQIIDGDIFEHNSSSGTPITYKAPPAAPPKPNWPPPPQQNGFYRNNLPDSPTGSGMVAQAWPPKKSSATDLPRTGFNAAAVREQAGDGRRCVWPPPSNDDFRSGRNTPQSPQTGRRIQWNPSPSPPLSRRTVVSPSRRKDIQWPPPAANSFDNKENMSRFSPRMSRKARFDDYVHQHASINVPQTYRPPPGTQHVEYH